MCCIAALKYVLPFLIIGLFDGVTKVLAAGPLCLDCTNLNSPTDCDHLVQCSDNQKCFTQQTVTDSGNIVYDSGCASADRCAAIQGRRSLPEMDYIDNTYTGDSEDPVTTCYDCCGSSMCNRELCTPSTGQNSNKTYCMSCADVLKPEDCETVVMCTRGEICFTESILVNGAKRYRLGCVSQFACTSKMTLPDIVGKKRASVDTTNSSCNKCCFDGTGHCNKEICNPNKPDPSGILIYDLINPPQASVVCADVYPTSCNILIIQHPTNCNNPEYSEFACRKSCGTCVDPEITTTPHPALTSPKDCFYNSQQYRGISRRTISGKACLKWETIRSDSEGFPDDTVTQAEDYCRDPDGRGHPWCYTSTETDWEFCSVPYCQECYYAGHSHTYKGYVNLDRNNEPCLPWSYVKEHAKSTAKEYGLKDANFSDKSIQNASNYCRDPYSEGHLSCYVNRQNLTQSKCNIPTCSGPCQNNPSSKCDLLQSLICKTEYAGVTMCPNTCGHCNSTFGLLQPMHVSPPQDKCIDNANASCAALKLEICKDRTGALNYCPKTCKLCDHVYNPTTQGLPRTTVAVAHSSLTQRTTHSTMKVSTATTHHLTITHTVHTTAKPPSTTAKTTATTANVSLGACHNDPKANCERKDILDLFCSSTVEQVQQLCRKSCNFCDKPITPVQINPCGDNVPHHNTCHELNKELCICNDTVIQPLCSNYCDNKCLDHPLDNSGCKITKKRDLAAILEKYLNV